MSKNVTTQFRLEEALLDKLDAYISKQRFKPSRTEIVTTLLTEFLDSPKADKK